MVFKDCVFKQDRSGKVPLLLVSGGGFDLSVTLTKEMEDYLFQGFPADLSLEEAILELNGLTSKKKDQQTITEAINGKLVEES